MSTIPRILRMLFAGFIMFGVLQAASATAPELRKELSKVALDIKELLKGQNEDAIAVGAFTGPANFPATSGPSITNTLTEELKKISVNVKSRAKYGIKGQYYPNEIPDENQGPLDKAQVVQLKYTVEDGFGKVINDYVRTINLKEEASYAEMLGLNASFTKSNGKSYNLPEQAKILKKSLAQPQVYKQGNSICTAGPDCPYAMEILVYGKPRSIIDDDGLPFVKIDKGETYAVRLINNSPFEAGVRLNIDGLSMYTFSNLRNPKTKDPLYSLVIVPPKNSVIIKGWHKDNSISEEFLVTDYAKSGAGLLNHKDNVGTINATFHAAFTGDFPPDGEPDKRRGVGTGFGNPVDSKFVEVRRNIGAMRASISIRYTK